RGWMAARPASRSRSSIPCPVRSSARSMPRHATRTDAARRQPMTRAAYLLRRAARLALRRPRLALWAIGAIAAALTAFAIVRVAATNVATWTASWRGGASMVVYFTPTATPARIDAIADRLRATDGIDAV